MSAEDPITAARTTEPGRWRIAARRLAVLLVVAALGLATGLAVDRFMLQAGDDEEGSSTATDGGADALASAAGSAGRPAATDPPTEPDEATDAGGPAADEAPASPEVVEVVPDRTSRLVATPPERILDTRDGDRPAPDTVQEVTIEPGPNALALSVTLMATERQGALLVDGRAGSVEAITTGGAGTTTTNLVVVPVVGDTLTFRSTAGGHLVADVVGTFEPSTGSSAGRFVPLEAATIGRLETAVDGRELELTFASEVPYADADAVLVSIAADVGGDGGMVRLGPELEAYDQMLMWDPTAGDDRQRRGLALVEPSPERLAALRYDGGSELTVDVLGYFTGEDAPSDTAGLFVVNGPRVVVDGILAAEVPVSFDLAEVDISAALLTVGSTSATPGRMGSVLLPAEGRSATLTPSQEVDATVTLLGVFLE